jgi:hypothetical protein
MPSPFPGMDPFIESQRWKDFHGTIVPVFRELLVPNLRPAYICDVDEYVFLIAETGDVERHVGPDISVVDDEGTIDAGRQEFVATLEPRLMTLAKLPQTEQKYLRIRSSDDGELVTVIELLSPTNKSRGEGQQEYLRKRSEYAMSPAHIVEIDLLRGGQRLPFEESLPKADFLVSVARASLRPHAEVYAWRLRDPLPIIPIPLKERDPDVPLDLQSALTQVYDKAGYDYSLRYDRDIQPPLSSADQEWVESILNRHQSKSA